MEKATIAGGCFWGIEHAFKDVPGVISTRVGYMGGHLSNPTYNDVKKGNTGHAEVCEVVFDPSKTSYQKILDEFFDLHDPTQVNRQGVDVGTQYRTEIFYHNDSQKQIAEQALKNEATKHTQPIATKVTPASEFFAAEDYHQRYFVKNPNSPCIHECHRRKKVLA